MRAELIHAIVDLAGDELESHKDYIELAIKSDEQLVEQLINIARYYKNISDEEV